MLRKKAGEWTPKDVMAAIQNKPPETEVRHIDLDGNTLFIQVLAPDTALVDTNSFKTWVEDFKKVLPKNAYLVVTNPNIEFRIERPQRQTVTINIQTSRLNKEALEEDFVQALKNKFSSADTQINFTDCEFVKEDFSPELIAEEALNRLHKLKQ